MKVNVGGVKPIPISGEFIRLDSFLKFICVASTGGEAKILIQDGRIYVNGNACTVRGKKLRDGDIVRYGSEVFLVQNRTLST